MKKIFKYLIMGAIALSSLSCAKAEKEFEHGNCSISEIYIYIEKGKNGWTISDQISGVVDEEKGQILFPIPRRKADIFDPSKVLVKANLGYDAYVNPPLTGLKDLSKEFTITVSCPQTGAEKTYTLLAYYSKN